jgi:hypothetical protein
MMFFFSRIFRGAAYLVMVMYESNKVLTTFDDILPMMEIDESYSSVSAPTLNSDLQFLIKVK